MPVNTDPAGINDPLVAIPKWFRDVSPAVDEHRLKTLRLCVTGLANADVPLPTLVRVAHRVADDAVLEALDTALLACTPTYAADRLKEELCRLAAAALILVMASPDGADDERRAVLAALLIESAHFSKLEPVLDDLTTMAKHRLDISSRTARARLSNSTSVRAVSKVARVPSNEDTPDSERMYELVVERGRAINTIVTRLEELVASFNQRLDLMDEEIDVLWWARTDGPASVEESWTTMKPLDRAVVAAHEVNKLIKHHPPTHSTQAVLASVVDGAATSHRLVDILAALDLHQIMLTEHIDHVLRPLAAGLATYRRLHGVADVVPGVLLAEGQSAADVEVTGRVLAEQLLREWAIEALG